MARLIVFIVIFAVFLGFIVLNLNHKCDISFGFKTFEEVPIFISIFVSFVIGMLVAIPMVFSFRHGRKKSSHAELQELGSDSMEAKKRSFLGRRKKIPKDEEKSPRWHGADSSFDEIKKEDSSYGID